MRCMIACVLLSVTVSAQYPISANGLRWEGVTSSAGPFCWGFNCTPEPVTVVPGESGILRIRAELNQPYVIAISTGASQCRTVPGAYNSLVLDEPFTILYTGAFVVGSPILACPQGVDDLSVIIPPSFTTGTTFSIQGATGTPGGVGMPTFSFTQALSFRVL